MEWITNALNGGNDFLNSALSWGMDLLGGKIGSDESYEKTRRLQKHNFEFQREMFQKQLDADNTALQRRMADADAAGLNANLLFGAGSQGAGTPSAGGGSAGSVSMESPKAELMTAMQISMQKDINEAEIAKKQAETVKTLIEAGYTEEKIKNATHERNLLIQNLRNAKTENEKAEAEKKIMEWESRHPVLSRVLPATAGATGAVMGAIAGGPIGAGIGFGIGHGFRKPNKIGFRNSAY